MTKYKVHTKKWKRCVRKVRAKDSSVNPYAVCTSRLGKKSFEKREPAKRMPKTMGGVYYQEWEERG